MQTKNPFKKVFIKPFPEFIEGKMNEPAKHSPTAVSTASLLHSAFLFLHFIEV